MAQIKIDADLNLAKLRKSFAELSAMVTGMSQKHGISLFDKESINFLKGRAHEALSGMSKEYDRLTSKAEEFSAELKKTAELTDAHKQKETQLLEVEKKRLSLMGDMLKLKKQLSAGGEQEKQGGFLEGFGSQLKGLPGGGMLSKLLGGGGLGMTAGLLGGAALAGGAWHVISKAREGNAQYNEGLRSRVALMGRGVGDYRGLNGGMARLGYSPEEQRQYQLQSTDIFGRAGSGGAAVYDRARFAKATGQDLGMIQNLGGGLRASMGVQQGTKAFAELEASLLSNKIKDAIGPYLETAASMLTELNENGMSFDASALSALGSVVRKTGLSPEMVSGALMSMNSQIQHSTGEKNAFFQSVFARGGVGGGTLGGTQEAVQLGMFGADSKKMRQLLNKSDVADYQNLNMTDGKSLTGFIRGMKNTMKDMNFGDTQEGHLQRNLFLQRTLGGGSGMEALGRFRMLEKIDNTTDPAKRKKLLGDFKDEFGSNEEKALKLQGDQKNLLEKIGEEVSPGFQAANRALLSIDSTLMQIARKGFGIALPEGPEEHRSRMLKDQGMTDDQLANMSPEETEAQMGRIRGDIAKSQRSVKANARGLSPDISKVLFDQAGAKQGDMAEVLVILKQHLEIARKQLHEQRKPVAGLRGQKSTGQRNQ